MLLTEKNQIKLSNLGFFKIMKSSSLLESSRNYISPEVFSQLVEGNLKYTSNADIWFVMAYLINLR